MAGIWGTGFELQSTTVNVEWRTGTAGSPNIETTEPITGNASLRINSAGSAENISQIVATAQGVRFYQLWIKLKTAATTDGLTIASVNNSSNRKAEFRIRNSANGNKLQLFNNEDAAQIGSDSPNLTVNAIYILELKIDSTTLASTTVEAKLYTPEDRTTLLWNPSGTIDITADPNRWIIGIPASDATFNMIYDNAVCWDNSGSFMNDWSGGWEVTCLRPSGDVSSAWNGNDGDSTNNYLLVDETTPDDATSYVGSNTATTLDKYDLDNTPSYLESTDIIDGVFVGARFAISSVVGGDPDFKEGIDVGGTTDYTGNLSGAGSTVYASYQTGNNGWWPSLANDSNYQQPGGATAYDKTALDGMQVAIEETVTDTHQMRVSAVWVYVLHKPAPVTGKAKPFRRNPFYLFNSARR